MMFAVVGFWRKYGEGVEEAIYLEVPSNEWVGEFA